MNAKVVHGQVQNSKQKHATKKTVGFHTHCTLSTAPKFSALLESVCAMTTTAGDRNNVDWVIYPRYQFVNLDHLAIPISPSIPNNDVRTFAQGYCVAILILSFP